MFPFKQQTAFLILLLLLCAPGTLLMGALMAIMEEMQLLISIVRLFQAAPLLLLMVVMEAAPLNLTGVMMRAMNVWGVMGEILFCAFVPVQQTHPIMGREGVWEAMPEVFVVISSLRDQQMGGLQQKDIENDFFVLG